MTNIVGEPQNLGLHRTSLFPSFSSEYCNFESLKLVEWLRIWVSVDAIQTVREILLDHFQFKTRSIANYLYHAFPFSNTNRAAMIPHYLEVLAHK